MDDLINNLLKDSRKFKGFGDYFAFSWILSFIITLFETGGTKSFFIWSMCLNRFNLSVAIDDNLLLISSIIANWQTLLYYFNDVVFLCNDIRSFFKEGMLSTFDSAEEKIFDISRSNNTEQKIFDFITNNTTRPRCWRSN